MDRKPSSDHVPATPGSYEIRFQGELDERWNTWFDGLAVTPSEGTTVVSGHFVDQAAIHGVLERVRDLGLGLISVTRLPSNDNEQEKQS